jgi:hypothetical protein
MVRFEVVAPAVASYLVAFAVVSGTGCGTDAKDVDECRDIEQARCEAAKPCGLVDDVDACKRFYRDHCLHGMVVESPGRAQVNACVDAIREAGDAKECNTVLYPERTAACSFLSPSKRRDDRDDRNDEGGAPGKAPETAGRGGVENR